METYVNNKELVIVLVERIDYMNVRDVEAEIFDAVNEHPGLPLCLDADKLIYISSAGLRVMMKLRKECKAGFSIRNTSPEVYDIFDMTGMTGIVDVRKKHRRFDTEHLPVIGKGASGTVYRLDDETVIKVYEGGEEMLPFIEEEQMKARQAFLSGLPTAIPYDIVRVGDKYGAVFEMINANNLGEIIQEEPSRLSEIIPAYAEFIKILNSKEAYKGQLPAARDIYLKALAVFGTCLPEQVCARVRELLEGLPDDLHLLHGDMQVKNVMLSGDEMILIDMDNMCTGNPVFEFAGLYVTYVALNEVDPNDTLQFLGLDRETCSTLFHGTLREYLQMPDEDTLRLIVRKIRTAGYLRLLRLILIEGKIANSDKSERCIKHAVNRLGELVFEVQELAI